MPTTTEIEKPVAVIITALPVEYNAVRSHLTNIKEQVHPQGTIYEKGIFSSNGQSWDVAIAETGEGNEQTALEVERAIQYFNPRIILFVGVAGGIKDVEIGDVVVASKVYGYESGKAGEAFKPRPEVGMPNYKMINRSRAEARKDDWLQRVEELTSPRPNVFIKPIAAGSKVINSIRSTVYEFIKSNYDDTLAVEMEGYGFLRAAYANPSVCALVIRGISDLIEGKEAADKAGSQKIASVHAGAFAFEVLAKSYNDSIDLDQYKLPEESSPEKVNTFSFPNNIAERINKFGENRISLINANETPVPLKGNAKIILHLIPLSSVSSDKTYDMSNLPFNPKEIQPFSSMAWNGRYNMDGYLTYSTTANGKAYSYVQLFKNGIFEAVESSLLEPELSLSDLKIPHVAFEEYIMKAFDRYISNLKVLNVGMPIFAFLTLVGVKGYSLTNNPSWIFRGDSIDKDVLSLPEVIIENFEFEVEKVLKPWFDTVWNACGFPYSLNYDISGKWIGRARC